MRNTLLLTVVALYAVGCASSATHRPPQTTSVPPQSAVAVAPSHTQVEAEQFRKELEATYAQILARSERDIPSDAPAVDLEAAASIPIPQHRTIDSAVRLFSVNMKDSIQTSLIRSGRYRKLIDKALDEERLPKGLAYLPVIESAYMPALTSRAGAHGIWQFMPDTAREYGLRVDWWIDERADPERSTKAAAAYLRDLHRTFGDWSLALAAYNCGPGRVRRTLSEAGATSFWELLDAGLLPKETRGYVPTFYATLIIASDPSTYGFTLGRVRDEDDQKQVEVRGPVSLAWIAEAIGADEDLLRELNPALRRGVVPPGRAHVRVPAKLAQTLAARADTLREEDAYVKYCSFRVRRGDTIKRLASAIGAKPEVILAMNGLDANDRPDEGDVLYLPVRARELGTMLASYRDQMYYAVKKGDTLYSIAKKNGLTVAELRDLNELDRGTALKVGQKLRVTPQRGLSAGGM